MITKTVKTLLNDFILSKRKQNLSHMRWFLSLKMKDKLQLFFVLFGSKGSSYDIQKRGQNFCWRIVWKRNTYSVGRQKMICLNVRIMNYFVIVLFCSHSLILCYYYEQPFEFSTPKQTDARWAGLFFVIKFESSECAHIYIDTHLTVFFRHEG